MVNRSIPESEPEVKDPPVVVLPDDYEGDPLEELRANLWAARVIAAEGGAGW